MIWRPHHRVALGTGGGRQQGTHGELATAVARVIREAAARGASATAQAEAVLDIRRQQTVVYLHGLGGDGSDVKSINTQLASQARVCTYDRVNVGRSDSDPARHTGADSVRDLHALLDAAAVPGPYLLVGFSFGGLLAIMYAATYPDQVMGLVSLDGSLPTDDQVDQLIPKDERTQVMAEQETNQERVEFYRTTDEAKALVAKVPDVPVTYLAARPVELPPNWPVKRMQTFIAAKQLQFTKTVPQGRLVEVQSSHDIDLEQPELVIKEINRILEMA
jgi:pimeloyl-ACP methyl ester carboxylesterase